jgi:4-amino-4-deoxy-L-arabinose transferase-like glycosyltransferase
MTVGGASADASATALRRRILSIVVLAFALRIPTLFWATPLQGGAGPLAGGRVHGYHYDERKIFSTTALFPDLYRHPAWVCPTYGTSVQCVLGAALLPVRAGFAVCGAGEYWTLAAWIASRFFSVLLGTATVYLAFLLARRFHGNSAGLWAALLLALNPGHILHSSLATLDVALGFLVTASTLLALRASDSGRRSAWAAAGVVCGMTAGCKFNGALIFLVPGVLLALSVRRAVVNGQRLRRGMARAIASLAICCSAGGVVFAATDPHVVFGVRRILRVLRKENVDWVERLGGGLWPAVANTAVITVAFLGVAWVLLAAWGLLARRREAADMKIAALVFLAAFFLFWRGFLLPRYLVAVVPFFAWLGGAGLVALLTHPMRMARGLGVLLLVASVAEASVRDAALTIGRFMDPRPAAAVFIGRNLPAGATLGIAHASERYKWSLHSWAYPWVDVARFRMTPFLQYPEYVVVSGFDWAPIVATLERKVCGPGYTLPESEKRNWYRYSPPSPRVLAFFDELRDARRSRYRLLAHFTVPALPVPEGRPPDIWLYQLKPSAGAH